MSYNKLIAELMGAIESARSGADRGGADAYIDFFLNDESASGSNQMLLFMKPELTADTADTEAIGAFVFEKLEQYGLSIENAFVISGGYIDKHRIICAHYGLIDAAAHAPMEIMTEAMWQRFEEVFGGKREEARLVGGVEYLEQHRELDVEDLSSGWLERGYEKLGSGVYCQRLEGEGLYLINGFYPRLLKHFTKPEACLACFVLRGSTHWRVARNEFAGATAPEKARPGSIRNELLVRRESFRLHEISANLNGIHLSAGPVEGAVEILRFSARHQKLSELLFGSMLLEEFAAEQIDEILGNGKVQTEEGETTFFDLTEELDSEDAIHKIKTALEQS